MSRRPASSPHRGKRLLTLALAGSIVAAIPLWGATAAQAGDAFFPPLAADDHYEMVQGTILNVQGAVGLLANDTLYDAGPLEVDATFGQIDAEATIYSGGSLLYTPDPTFVGTRTFTYQAIDKYSHAKSNIATVTITVTPEPNGAPIANPDSYSMMQGSTLHIDAPGVLANDTDPDGDPIKGVSYQGLPSSELVLNVSGWLTFTPDPAFTGTATFQYRISDSSNLLSDWATVTIIVSPKAIPEPPIANPDSYTTSKDVPLTVSAPGVLANDTLPTGSIADWSDPANEVALALDGSFVYTPPKGFVGTKTFTYNMSANGSADDVSSQSNWATVTITVTDTTDGGTDPGDNTDPQDGTAPGPTPTPTAGTGTLAATLAATGSDTAPLFTAGGILTAMGIILSGIAVWRRRSALGR